MYDLEEFSFVVVSRDTKQVAKLLATDPRHEKINSIIGSDNTALYLAVRGGGGSFDYDVGNYQIAILLLKAGADPFYLQARHFNLDHRTSSFFRVLRNHNLALARLILWFRPDYEKLPVPEWEKVAIPVASRAEIITAEGFISWLDEQEVRARLGRGFAEVIKATALDVRRVRELQRLALEYAAAMNFKDAAAAYEEIIGIYEKQARLEDSLKYFTKYEAEGCTDKLYRPVLKEFYLSQRQEYFEQLYIWYQLMDERLTSVSVERETSAARAAFVAEHARILDCLIRLGRVLKKDESTVILPYLAKAARVRLDVVRVDDAAAEMRAASAVSFAGASSSVGHEDGESVPLLKDGS